MTTKLLTKVSTGLATGGVLLALAVIPSFASTTITTSHNGANSNNTVGVVNTTVTGTTQTNNTSNFNAVNTFTGTGLNSSSFNTGGKSGVQSGPAKSTTTINNISGLNIDASDPCGCGAGNTSATIKGNGANSKNSIGVFNTTVNTVDQTNNTANVNVVNTTTTTGGNSSSFNTNSNSGVVSGGASSTTTINNVSGGNAAGL